MKRLDQSHDFLIPYSNIHPLSFSDGLEVRDCPFFENKAFIGLDFEQVPHGRAFRLHFGFSHDVRDEFFGFCSFGYTAGRSS